MPTLKNVTTATITLHKIEEVSLYQAEIISTNGNIFHPYDIYTELFFKVYLNNEDITSNFKDIEWVKYSQSTDSVIEDLNWGVLLHGNTSIPISKSDVDKKCIIQANAYMEINKVRTCVASARITLIDVNELYSNPEPPDNPTDGSLWVNTSYNPPIIYSWSSTISKWIEVGKTTPFVRNLIKNSNFLRLNTEEYLEDNPESLQPIRIHNFNDKEWALLRSKMPTMKDISAGLFQATNYPIVRNSDYCFSFLAYRTKTPGYDGENIYCKIISVNSANENSTLIAASIPIKAEQEVQIAIPFQTLNDTENIKCFIGVEPEKMCEYYITQLSLYNAKNHYPWEPSPEDVQWQLEHKLDSDHESVFNALTRGGTMEGIYVRADDDGVEHFYFNASHLQSGSIDGGLINGIGLNIKDDITGESIFHVYRDENGTHIDLIANNLLIGQTRETASTIGYVNSSMATAQTNAIASAELYTNNQIKGVNEEVSKKADNTVVVDLETRVSNIENVTEDDVIIGTVTNSEIYTIMITENERNFKKLFDAMQVIGEEVDAVEKDIEDNIKTALLPSALSEAVRGTQDYKDDLNLKVNTSDFDTYKTNLNDYLDGAFNSVNIEINKKANEEKVSGIDGRVTTLEANTKASAIVSTVRQSTDYITDLSKKLNAADFNTYKIETTETLSSKANSSTIINTINKSAETEKINKSKVDLGTALSLNTIYTSDGIDIKNQTGFSPTITVDNIIDNINFIVTDTDINMQVYNLRNTNYVTVFNEDANIYMNNNEMIKLLLYEIKNLKARIKELEDKE